MQESSSGYRKDKTSGLFFWLRVITSISVLTLLVGWQVGLRDLKTSTAVYLQCFSFELVDKDKTATELAQVWSELAVKMERMRGNNFAVHDL